MRYRINWDWLGIGASVICAIHCALLPLLLTSLPLFGINIIHHLGFELGMIALALVIGSYSMYHGYKKHHHRLTPWLLFLLGGGFLVLKQLFPDYQLLLLVPAVALIIYAHLLNVRSCRSHNHAHADDCRH
ncbi:MAG: MerC domain-containing protein [Sphingomonadales bacterium]|jgi:hypothetical protein